MKRNRICLTMIASIFFVSCGTFRTHSEVYKPIKSLDGYVFTIPDILDSFMVVINPEYGFYDYRYYKKNSNIFFFISNDTGFYDMDMLHATSDTITYSGKDTIRCQQYMVANVGFWKVRCILQNPRYNDWEHGRYPMFTKVSYGYFNVPKKHLRKFDKIINSIEPLSDTSIIQDKRSIEWGLSDN